ncbi:unnamed protein product [Ixodes pacificus]
MNGSCTGACVIPRCILWKGFGMTALSEKLCATKTQFTANYSKLYYHCLSVSAMTPETLLQLERLQRLHLSLLDFRLECHNCSAPLLHEFLWWHNSKRGCGRRLFWESQQP